MASSQKASLPSPLPLTFGVELEALFAVKQGPAYRAYAWYAYMEYIQKRLANKGLSAHAQLNPKAELDYTKWNVTYDGSLLNEGHLDLLNSPLKDRVTPDNVGLWSPHSLEIVSPPMPVPDTQLNGLSICKQSSIAEIKKCIKAITGTKSSPHGAFVNEDCGLHIHVGMAPQPKDSWEPTPCIPLPVLKQLAFLIIRYEAILTSLQDHGRNPLPDSRAIHHCRSNSIAFRFDGHTCHDAPLEPLSEIRSRIFSDRTDLRRLCYMMGSEIPLWASFENKKIPSCPVKSKDLLCTYLGHDPEDPHTIPADKTSPADDEGGYGCGNKYKIVRWNLLPRHPPKGPRTIEFRQARGSLDAEEVGCTVHLVTSLVRTAERLANGQAQMISDDEPATFENLCKLLQLEKGVRRYWAKRRSDAREEAEKACRTLELLSRKNVCEACNIRCYDRSVKRQKRTKAERGWREMLGGKARRKKTFGTKSVTRAEKANAKRRIRDSERRQKKREQEKVKKLEADAWEEEQERRAQAIAAGVPDAWAIEEDVHHVIDEAPEPFVEVEAAEPTCGW